MPGASAVIGKKTIGHYQRAREAFAPLATVLVESCRPLCVCFFYISGGPRGGDREGQEVFCVFATRAVER